MMPKTWNRYGYCWNNPTRFVDLNGRTPELPVLQLLPTEEESIVPDLFDGLTIKENESNLSYFFDDDEIDEMKEIIRKVREEQQRQDSGPSAVVTLGGGIGVGEDANVGISGQFAFDTLGNFEPQGTISTGMLVGAEGRFAGVLSVYPGMKSVADSEGFGVNVGVSGGFLGWGGIDIILSGEGADMRPAGFSISLGLGAGGGFHINMSETTKIGGNKE